MLEIWNWIAAHPWEAAGKFFAISSAIALVYRGAEGKLKAWAGRTPSKIDDKLVGGLSHFFGFLTILLDIVSHAAPAIVQKGTGLPETLLANPAAAREPETNPDDVETDPGKELPEDEDEEEEG